MSDFIAGIVVMHFTPRRVGNYEVIGINDL